MIHYTILFLHYGKNLAGFSKNVITAEKHWRYALQMACAVTKQQGEVGREDFGRRNVKK